jgi:hypothetical protein
MVSFVGIPTGAFALEQSEELDETGVGQKMAKPAFSTTVCRNTLGCYV